MNDDIVELPYDFEEFPKVTEEQAEIESHVESEDKPEHVDKSNEIRIPNSNPKQARSQSVKCADFEPPEVSK